MLYRSISMALVALAMVLFVSQAANGQDKPHEGTIVKTADGKLTMTAKGSDKEHTHDVAKDAKITLDGKPAKLADLKKGFHVTVTMEKHVATKIEAHSKGT